MIEKCKKCPLIDDRSDFEKFWNDRGDRWNGILNIRKWSEEIWNKAVESVTEKLIAIIDKNKNCLNCHNYYLNNGNELNCKLGKKFHTICKEWMQK